MHPLFINAWVPEELHHDDELSELRDLAKQDKADVQPQCPLVDSELATLLQIVFYVEDGADEENCGPQGKHVLDPEEYCEGQFHMALADACITL